MTSAKSRDVVKSVRRVFEVLELFDRLREPLSANTVEKALGYPQSSTLALLKSMMELGYLSYDKSTFCYMPTMRVALLGAWVESDFLTHTRLAALMDEIRKSTGETVAISCQADLEMQFIRIRLGTKLISLSIQEGTQVPIFNSSIGLLLLAYKTEAEIDQLADRVDEARLESTPPIDRAALRRTLENIRRNGYALGFEMVERSISTISWMIPDRPGYRELVISVSGPTDRIRQEADDIIHKVQPILDEMRREIAS